jgi:hypothetical protein
VELEISCSNKILRNAKTAGAKWKKTSKKWWRRRLFGERESLVFLEARRGKGLQSSDQICHGRKKSGVSLLCARNEMNCVFNAVGVREKSASSASQ